MKRTLLTVVGLAAMGSAFAQQTPSPSWTITQNAGFPITSAGIRFMDAVDPNVVWVAGYDGMAPSRNYNWVSRTTNGGNTWNSNVVWSGTNTVVGDTNTWIMANLEGVDANTAWVSAYKKQTQSQGGIFRTTNGGASWQNMTAAGMYTNSAAFTNIVVFTSPMVGITQGDPIGAGNEFEIWRTTDGGNSWAMVPGANIPNPINTSEYGLVNVYTKHGNNIWFGTNKGRVYYSNDAGLTWNVSQLPTMSNANAYVNDIAFADPFNGVAYVYNVSTTPATFEMFNTTDGGVTWTAITSISPNVGRNDLAAIPGTTYFASVGAATGNQIISYSVDNGLTWTSWGGSNIQYLTVDFVDGNNGWAGSFSDQTNATVGGIFKYNGPTLTSTTPPTAYFTVPGTLCSTGGAATVTPTNGSTGTAPLNYQWSGSTGVIFSNATAATPLITFPSNGTYTVTLQVSNTVTNNTTSQIVNVISCTSPVAAFTAPTPSNPCNNVVYTFTNTSTGTPTPTYTWSTSPANATITPSPFSTNASIAFGSAGVYSVTLIAANASGSAAVTQTFNVNNCAPNVGFTLPAAWCVSTPLTMTNTTTGNTPLTYSWSVVPSPGSISNVTAPSPTINFVNPNTYTITLKATNNSGSTTLSQTLSVGACTGLSELSLAGFEVYPNPASDFVSVSVPSQYSELFSLTLTNVLGSVVHTEKYAHKNSATVKVAALSKGVYFLTIESKGEKVTRRIVVE